jgi:H+-transporting ATPase
VFPEHKFRIIDVLQKHGHIVGMTGDGVNDAPALKKADCGIAVSGATDAARAAASIVLLSPGLSVIIDAIKESRRIFQRMNSYSMYRIAETLRVLLFMTLAILVFNFYPVTAVMIVMLALLNDGAILSIAYDNVRYRNHPEAWNMRLVLGVSTVLGVFGVVAAFGLFFLADRVFHLDHARIQTLMYLKLSVAGHLTIFLTRTRGPFWSIRPARILLIAVFGTQAVATLIAVYGLFMPPLGWGWAAFVWGYAIVWFLLTDPVKLLAYRLLDPDEAGPTSAAKTASPPQVRCQPDKAHKLHPKAAHGADTGVAALLDTKLSDVLLAGVLKDPQEAGHIIARAIAEAEASKGDAEPPAPKANARAGVESHPDHGPKPKAPSKPQTPTGTAGMTAK